jgi:hypothetical protein
MTHSKSTTSLTDDHHLVLEFNDTNEENFTVDYDGKTYSGKGHFSDGFNGAGSKQFGLTRAALDRQEGGNHYSGWVIQPVEFLHKNKNKIGWCEANIIKYTCRWKDKNGLEDLKKARHYIDLLIELEGLE